METYIFGSAILGFLLYCARKLGSMDTKLTLLCSARLDHEKRLRQLELHPGPIHTAGNIADA